MPYFPFPETWSIFKSKDQVANFLEQYARLLNLNVRLDTTMHHASFDAKSKLWSLEISSGGGKSILHPRHVILATGVTTNQTVIPKFKDQEYFKGLLYHAEKHGVTSYLRDLQSRKIVIIGSNTSGHDIAQDFVNRGAKDVTIIQRGASPVFTASTLLKTLAPPLPPGVTLADADLISKGTPNFIMLEMAEAAAPMIAHADKKVLDGLGHSGFAALGGGKGFFDSVFRRAGGFYIDVGASQMIIDGKIKVKRCAAGIDKFVANGIMLKDNRMVEADVVILATGWKLVGDNIQNVMGDEIAKKCWPVWGLDEEGELRSVGLFPFQSDYNKC